MLKPVQTIPDASENREESWGELVTVRSAGEGEAIVEDGSG